MDESNLTVGQEEEQREAEIRRFGVEPELDQYIYDVNSCAQCGQPVLIMQSKERLGGYRSERVACEYCYSRLSKRTKARHFRWVFLPGWRP